MGWSKAEERGYCNKSVLKILIIELLYDAKTDEAMSIIHRHSFLSNDFADNPKVLQMIKDIKHYTYKPNIFFEKDNWNPTLENIGKNQKGTFLNIKDFGMTEKDIIFVNSDLTSEF